MLHCMLQADKLVSKSSFPESASTNEWARFLYYTGNMAIWEISTFPFMEYLGNNCNL